MDTSAAPRTTTSLMRDTGIRLLLTYRLSQPDNGTTLGVEPVS